MVVSDELASWNLELFSWNVELAWYDDDIISSGEDLIDDEMASLSFKSMISCDGEVCS